MTENRLNALIWACLILLLLVGFHLRTTRLADFPPGISADEATNLVDYAHFARSGRLPLFQDHERPEPLNRLYGGLASRLFGDSVFAHRYTSVLLGMLSLSAVFWASGQCFAEQPRRVRHLIATLALACLIAALSHITINRSLYRAVPLVAFVALAAGFICRALRRNKRRDYVACAIFLALGCYTYTAALVVPLAFPPLALQLALFHRRSWRRWLPGLTLTAVTLFVLTLPISFLLLTQPEALLSRASQRFGAADADWLAKLGAMTTQFLSGGDANPQYNAASAPLVPPPFTPFFLVGLAALVLRLRQPASILLLGLLIFCSLPALLTSITNGLRVHLVYALIPLIAGASLVLPLSLIRRHSRLTRPFALICLCAIVALALYAAVDARRVFIDYWANADSYWRKWRIHDLDLSHSDWFFRADRKRLADWIARQDEPLLLPLSELDHPTLRALLMAKFPLVESLATDAALPPRTRIIAPWSLETHDFIVQTARLALLHGDTISVLPPLALGSRHAVYSNSEESAELLMPGSAFPAAARVQSLPPGWTPEYLAAESRDGPLARFNRELELRSLYGPRTIAAPGDYEYALDWSVTRPVSHEYGAFLQLLTADWAVVAGEDQHLWRWLLPTVAWQPGAAHSQLFTLSIAETLPPGAYRLVAGAWYLNGADLPAESFVDEATDGIATIAWIKSPQRSEAAILATARPLAIEFGGQVALTHIAAEGADDGATVVDLYWTATKSRPAFDATIFLHALDEQGGLIAQQDARPWGGRYPTFIWDAGEIVATRHRLHIPNADGVKLALGMYTQPDFRRLAAQSNGEPLPDDVADLGALKDLLGTGSP